MTTLRRTPRLRPFWLSGLVLGLLMAACSELPTYGIPGLPSFSAAGGEEDYDHTLTALGDSVYLATPKEPVPGTPGTPGFWAHPNDTSQPCPPGLAKQGRCVWNPGTPDTPGDSTYTRLTNLTPEVLELTDAGYAIALAEGVGYVQISRDTEYETVSVRVLLSAPPEPPTPPQPPVDGEWDRVLADTSVVGDVVVPDGERWLIGQNVRVQGNVRTHNGTIALRAGSSLTFVGADPAKYAGGGMHFEEGTHDNDIGLWIGAGHGATGKLDIQCSPKAGWNRTGVDPTWEAGDEYWIAPTAPSDYRARRWYPGQTIPRADPRVPAAEVINVTRDCVIEGPGHIHIHSTVPQRIEYVQLRAMGVTIPGKQDSGRYALHLHMMGEGSRGTVVRGVAAIDSRGRVYVPHTSHGISFLDVVSVNSFGEAFWWDLGDRTNDILVDRLAVAGVRMPSKLARSSRKVGGVTLGRGDGLVMQNSAVSGVAGSTAHGYEWPLEVSPAEWRLENVVAHNMPSNGLRFWLGTQPEEVHIVRGFTSYNTGWAHSEHPRNQAGVLSSMYRLNNLFIENATVIGAPVAQRGGSLREGQPQTWKGLTVHNPSGPAIYLLRNANRWSGVTEFANCSLEGTPKVRVAPASGHPHYARFRDCGVQPADIVFDDPIPSFLVGSWFEIWENGKHRWTVSVDAQRKKVVTTF